MAKTNSLERFGIHDIPKGWQIKKLKDILIEGRLGGNYENAEANNGIPVIKMGNLDRSTIKIDKIQYLPGNETHNQEDVLVKGDLLFNTRNTLELVGKVAIWNNELPFAVYNSNLMRMKFDSSFVDSTWFMNRAFNSYYGLRQLRGIATGTTSVAAIYSRDLESIKFLLPPLPEQKAIVRVLSTADAAIHTTEKLIAQKELRKKWLMQQLLSEKRIVKNEKWCKSGVRRVTVGEIAKVFSGGTPSRKNPEFFKGNIPWIKSGEVNDFEIFDTEEKITEEAVKESATKVLEADTILVALYGATAGVVGITRIRAAINQAVLAIIPDEMKINKMYLLRLLEFNMPKAVENLVQGGQPNLSGGIIFHFPLFIVHSIEEQTAIAQVLQAADKEINLLKAKAEKLREQKKGLMQQLLSGKVRLKIN